MGMRWWIVEDALKNQTGHWREYLGTFRDGLAECGDDAVFFCDSMATSEVVNEFNAHAVLPESIWHRMDDHLPRHKRLARIFTHGNQTLRAMRCQLRKHESPDVIFVPTVTVHHLSGWWRLLGRLKKQQTQLILFFPNTPLRYDTENDCAALDSSPTAKIFKWLIRRFAAAVAKGEVILGAETRTMREALTRVTGVPFTYLPHPVNASTGSQSNNDRRQLRFGCYGAARFEKGSDLILDAIASHLDSQPESRSTFHVQWLNDFKDDSGEMVTRSEQVLGDKSIHFITRYFQGNEYAKQLNNTDVMILPYREPYRFRISRVAIEAVLNGIPIIAPESSTLLEQACEFGAGVSCQFNDSGSVAAAIQNVESNYESLKQTALSNQPKANQHFSVKHFRDVVLDASPHS